MKTMKLLSLLRSTTDTRTAGMHVVVVIAVHSASSSAVSLRIEILHVDFFVFFGNHWLFLWWQKFFQFGNDCRIHTFWKLHVELNYEFALFKWIAIGRHSF